MNIPLIVLLVINYCSPDSFFLFLLLLYQELVFCKGGGGVTVLDQGSNHGEVEAAGFWGVPPGQSDGKP